MHLLRIDSSHPLSDFWRYELSAWLNTLARSLVSVFVPVLMLVLGYSVKDVVLYYLIYSAIDVPLNFVARAFIRKFGGRASIAVATVMVILFFWLFGGLTVASWPTLILMAVCAAFADTFYWVAHIYLFVSSERTGHSVGEDTGILYAVRNLALLCGPLVGGLVLIFFDRDALFVVAVIFFILSVIPLRKQFVFDDRPRTKGLSMSEFFAKPRGRRAFIGETLYAIHDTIETILFPVFIFLLVGTLASVAAIPALISAAGIVLGLMLGKTAPSRRTLVIAVGAAAMALLWSLRLVVHEPLFYYASILLMSVFSYLVLIPIDSEVFENGKEVGDVLSASMYRNLSYMLANTAIFAVLVFLIDVLHASFTIAALGMLVLFLFTTIAGMRFHHKGEEGPALSYRDHPTL